MDTHPQRLIQYGKRNYCGNFVLKITAVLTRMQVVSGFTEIFTYHVHQSWLYLKALFDI